MKNDKNDMYSAIVSLVFSIAVLNLVLLSNDEPDIDDSQYCEMRNIWKQDEENGVIEIKRRGWPEFGDDSKCDWNEDE